MARILTLSFNGCVSLGKLLNLSTSYLLLQNNNRKKRIIAVLVFLLGKVKKYRRNTHYWLENASYSPSKPFHYRCALRTFLGHRTCGHDLDCSGAIQRWGRQEFSQIRVTGALFESLLCEKVGLPLQLILKLGQL